MTTESREQFRERIGSIAAASDGVPFDQLNETLQEAVSDQAEAVYVEALRDFHRWIATSDNADERPGWADVVTSNVEQFAADLGIDLDAKLD